MDSMCRECTQFYANPKCDNLCSSCYKEAKPVLAPPAAPRQESTLEAAPCL